MVVTIELKPEVEALLVKRAASQGCDVKDYVQKVIEKDVRSPDTFDEILAPFRREVAQSGVTEQELDQVFKEARQKVFKAKPKRKKR